MSEDESKEKKIKSIDKQLKNQDGETHHGGCTCDTCTCSDQPQKTASSVSSTTVSNTYHIANP